MLRPSVPTSIRIPFDLRRVLRKQARAEHRSISGLIVFVLDSFAKTQNLYETYKPPGTRKRPKSMEIEDE